MLSLHKFCTSDSQNCIHGAWRRMKHMTNLATMHDALYATNCTASSISRAKVISEISTNNQIIQVYGRKWVQL